MGDPKQFIRDVQDRHRVITVPIDLRTIVTARLLSNQHAPNGTEELLAWILNLLEVVEKQHQIIEHIKRSDEE